MNSARESHEAFVSGHSGSSAPDLILAVTPAFPASALAVLIIRGRAGWFAKTEEYGYSLMDVGAAGFVVINGIVETKKRPYYRYIMRDGVILSVLGVLRLVLVRAANYQHHVTEYGVHANFFFTLAFIKFTCSWWVCHLKCLGSAMVALFLCLCHHLYLTVGNGGPWTLSDIPRDTLLLANREWLVSMPGYVALYFLGASLGAFVFNRSGNTKLTRPLIVITLLCGGCLAGLHHYVDLPSRRLGNPTFAGFSSCS
ncbi:GPI-anchored wall transfer protein 1-like [Homarus americanus]|uniref:GPI-anchored wall transfer protein 1-like n=1 Tax=Homarus americanus TaxID=6706 RepID=A0A8J5TQD2_HOMAM|nr:GPI-anchored wall transfer protein 1-like [Homarus americanus]